MRITSSFIVACLLLASPAEAQRMTWTASRPPLTPAAAAAVLTASVPAFVPPYAGDQMQALSVTVPWPAPTPSLAERSLLLRPLSSQWTSVTTYSPRFGPPVTWFDGQAHRGPAPARAGAGPGRQRRTR